MVGSLQVESLKNPKRISLGSAGCVWHGNPVAGQKTVIEELTTHAGELIQHAGNVEEQGIFPKKSKQREVDDICIWLK